jgi:allantoin racemase
MRLLVLNANTSDFVTETVGTAARTFASPGTEIVLATGAFGARVITSRSEHAIAEHAAIDILARQADGCDGILVAVSYDTAVRAAREFTGLPVLGITEAALMAAMACGTRIGLVTFGKRVTTLYRELIAAHGWSSRLCGIRTIESGAPYAAGDQGEVDREIVAAALGLVARDDAEAIVLAGAVMAGRSRSLEAQVPVPLLDGVRCGVPMLEAMVRIGPRRPQAGSYAPVEGRETANLSSEIATALARKGTT